MKSIRLSLIVYFLLLVTAALGGISFLAYRTTAKARQEKAAINRQLLEAQYKSQHQEEVSRLDADLQAHARTLAILAQSQFEANRLIILQFTVLGTISSTAAPNGHLTTPVWLAETRADPLRFMMSRAVATDIRLDEDSLHRDEDKSTDYFQINKTNGRTYRSKSLGERSLPFDIKRFQQMQVYETEFDDIELDGVPLRRVLFRAPIFRRDRYLPPTIRIPESGRGARPGGGSPPNSPPPPQRVAEARPPGARMNEPPTFFIQCATEVSHRDQALGVLKASFDEQVLALETESQASLLELRQNLLWVSLASFVATIVGGFALVSFGLRPLRRLNEAVSRVSEDHLQLAYEGPSPPLELRPVIEGLTHALDLLQQAFVREKQSTADISHELRTPLAGLLATLEVTLRKSRTPDEYREALGECRDLAKLMTQLIERLLTLTRIDSRSDRLHVEPVDAADLAEQCACLVRPLARANGLNLQVHRDSHVRLTTDPDKLREVIANLMHNAVEYNRPAGTVDVSVRSTEGGLDLEVKDTGVGIAPEYRDRIFERFFRADPSRQSTGLHAGLGLAIVRGYVELMGGTITVESEVGRGSTFRVRIPPTDPVHRT